MYIYGHRTYPITSGQTVYQPSPQTIHYNGIMATTTTTTITTTTDLCPLCFFSSLSVYVYNLDFAQFQGQCGACKYKTITQPNYCPLARQSFWFHDNCKQTRVLRKRGKNMKNLQLQKFTTHSAKGFASQHGAARRLEDMFDGIFYNDYER